MRRRKLTAYLRHICTTFAVAALMILALLPIYQAARNNAHQLALDRLTANVETGFVSICENINNLQKLMFNLRHNTNIRTLAVSDDTKINRSNYIGIYNYRESIKNILMFDAWDLEFALQFRKNDLLLMRSSTFLDKKSAYERGFFYYKGMTYDEWQERLGDSRGSFWPVVEVYTLGAGLSEYMTYNLFYSPQLPTSVVCSVLIPVNALVLAVVPPEFDSDYFIYFTDDNGQILYSQRTLAARTSSIGSNSIAINDTAYDVVRASNKVYGLNVIVGFASDWSQKNVEPVTRLILLSIILALFVAAAYSVIYAFYHFRSVDSLMTLIPAQDLKKKGLYEVIRAALLSANAASEKLNRDYRRVVRILDNSAFWRAASAVQLSGDERGALEQKSVFGAPYYILAIRWMPGIDPNTIFTITKSLLEMEFQECEIYISGYIMTVLSAENNAYIEDKLLSIRAKLMLNPGAYAYFGVSAAHSGVDDITHASMEAQQALILAELSGDNISFWEGQKKEARPLFQHYVELGDYISMGDIGRIQRLFENFRGLLGVLPTEKAWLLLSNVHLVIQTALSDMPQSIPPDPLDERESPLSLLNGMERFLVGVCTEINTRREQRHREHSEQIISFIESEYKNPLLSLSVIACQFGVSESYISHYIKKHTGKNYSAHLEALRMGEALRLITNTELSVGDIAGLCGYENKNTFYKAFKKSYGFPPNHFRGQHF